MGALVIAVSRCVVYVTGSARCPRIGELWVLRVAPSRPAVLLCSARYMFSCSGLTTLETWTCPS